MQLTCISAAFRSSSFTAWPCPAQLGSSHCSVSFTMPFVPTRLACLDYVIQRIQWPMEGSDGREAIPSRRRWHGADKSKEPALTPSGHTLDYKLLGAHGAHRASLHSCRFSGCEFLRCLPKTQCFACSCMGFSTDHRVEKVESAAWKWYMYPHNIYWCISR